MDASGNGAHAPEGMTLYDDEAEAAPCTNTLPLPSSRLSHDRRTPLPPTGCR